MKVRIDENLCSGHGRCEFYADSVYKLDDVGYNSCRGQEYEVPTGHEDDARVGAESCPEQAITIID
ncbi:ferredoxin [Zhongshania sp.]|jgi:ferredoxin|uniref:ferredoxin n=1 Tax=Zhongshania sp. TaxID=1971902 RepID=UPI002A83CE9F|nr:ferredoxin [Zhongshania sp.]